MMLARWGMQTGTYIHVRLSLGRVSPKSLASIRAHADMQGRPLWQPIVFGANDSVPPHLEHHQRVFREMHTKPANKHSVNNHLWLKMFGPKFNEVHNITMLFEEQW